MYVCLWRLEDNFGDVILSVHCGNLGPEVDSGH